MASRNTRTVLLVFVTLLGFACLLVNLSSSLDESVRSKVPHLHRLIRRQNFSLGIFGSFHESKHNISVKKTGHDDGGMVPSHFRDIFSLSPSTSSGIGSENRTFKDKYFIYRCDETTLKGCAGWMDRIQGSLAAYLMANLTGRTFKMEIFMQSCDFHKYIVPNKVDWHVPVPFHEKVEESDDVSVLHKMDNKELMKDVDTDLTATLGIEPKFVYYEGNREYFFRIKKLLKYQAALSWMQNLTYGEIGNALYRRLFKPSAYLESRTKSFLAEHLLPHQKLVCAHMRTGKNPTIPRDSTYMRISERGIRSAIHFLHEMTKNNDSKIFFMSDNEDLISRMRNLSFGDKFFFSDGKIVHISVSRDISAAERCEGLEKIIFEHNVLLYCDVIMITKSAIGIYAALVRNTDSGLYCLCGKGIVGACEREDIMSIFDLVAL